MRNVLVAVAAVVLSGCKPELSYFMEFRPNRVLLEDANARLRLDVIRPEGYFGPVNVSAELQNPDGNVLMGSWFARVARPEQEALSNQIDVSLDSVITTPEVIVVARGELLGEEREARATLDLSLLGSWTITTVPPVASVDRGSMLTIDVEATGFNVEGTLELSLRMTSGAIVFGPVARAMVVNTRGRNNWPIARFSTTFVVPRDLTAPLKVSISGTLVPRRPLLVPAATQLKEFEIPVNE